MSHSISGIITSFKYEGDLPQVNLVGNYHFIPINRPKIKFIYEASIPPFAEFSASAKRTLKELSFKGKCAYVETDFFVEGVQRSSVWEDGVSIFGPVVSLHGYKGDWLQKLKTKYEDWFMEVDSINTALSKIGIYCHENKIDEFDSVRLGDYRSNEEIIEAYKRNFTTNERP